MKNKNLVKYHYIIIIVGLQFVAQTQKNWIISSMRPIQ